MNKLTNHTKQQWRPGTLIYPLPAVLVSCGGDEKEYNLITIAWVGTICSDPAMCYISVRKERHSFDILQKEKAFVINLTTEALARATDWCGCRSGAQYDKFKEMGLTAAPAQKVNAPIVVESPVNIECKVQQVIDLGSHTMFISTVENIQVDEELIDKESGEFRLQDANLIAYSHGHYYKLGDEIGHFGFSVRKKK